MSTFAQIRTRAAVRFGDSANSIITDATWKDYVNESYREVCSLEDWPFLEDSTTNLTVSAAARSVALPSNVTKVTAVWNSTDQLPMEALTEPRQSFDEYPFQDETGVPALYHLREGAIEVYPKPVASTVLTIWYPVYQGDLSADGDLPAFPVVYHHILVPLAVAKAYRDDGNLGVAQAYEGEAAVILEAMKRDLLAPRHDRFPTIVDNFYG